ncbi:MAG: trypsin-like peptidase domain-containing protein [Chloroflexota bacterium]
MSRLVSTPEAFIVLGGSRHLIPPHGLRVGRSPDNDLIVPDPNVSRQHLVVWSSEGDLFLRDLGSQNGTYVDGRRVGGNTTLIAPGAQIRIGGTTLAVEAREARPATGPDTAETMLAPGRPVEVPRQMAPAVAPMAVPVHRAAAPPRRGSSGLSVAIVLIGVAAVLLGGVAVTGVLVVRGASTARATPTPGPTPVVARATQVPPTAAPVAAKPTAPPPPPTAAAAPPVAAPPAAPPVSKDGRDPGLVRGLGGSVRILAKAGPSSFSTGSGTVVSARGHVLTNHHVVSDDNGVLLNKGEDVIIAVPPSEGAPAEPKFKAKVVADDAGLDFSVLQIISMFDGRPLPQALGLAVVPLGNSDSVQIGDPITIIGYPGLGGNTVTVTRGIYSGPFRRTPTDPPYFKTDTEINRGNSGGTAINAAGELIGVPTAGRSDQETSGKLGLIRPINLAKALINKASATP